MINFVQSMPGEVSFEKLIICWTLLSCWNMCGNIVCKDISFCCMVLLRHVTILRHTHTPDPHRWKGYPTPQPGVNEIKWAITWLSRHSLEGRRVWVRNVHFGKLTTGGSHPNKLAVAWTPAVDHSQSGEQGIRIDNKHPKLLLPFSLLMASTTPEGTLNWGRDPGYKKDCKSMPWERYFFLNPLSLLS